MARLISPQEKLVRALAALPPASLREVQSALEAMASECNYKLVNAPAADIFRLQGRAQSVTEIFTMAMDCRDEVAKIEAMAKSAATLKANKGL